MAPAASSILGESVSQQATVAAASGSGSVPSGTVQFRDGATILGTGPLDATGKVTFSANGLTLGSHSLASYYIAGGGYQASNSAASTLMVYANAPDLSLTLSTGTLQVSYGTTSSPVQLQVTSQSGMGGTVTFSCTGLPIGMTCNFNPTQANINAGGNAATSLTIPSTATQASEALWTRGIRLVLLPFSILRLWRIRYSRQRIQHLLSLLLLFALSLGCTLGLQWREKQNPELSGNRFQDHPHKCDRWFTCKDDPSNPKHPVGTIRCGGIQSSHLVTDICKNPFRAISIKSINSSAVILGCVATGDAR